ncbi:MAG: hypothetical protein PHI91_03490 [Candidatus Pacebacteria bacterium]|nr:hypothetical protein [Candidatus Paceibacterota bacterium]
MPLTKTFLKNLDSLYKYLEIFDADNKTKTHFVRTGKDNWSDGKRSITNENLIKLFKSSNKNHPNSMILYFTGGKSPEMYVFGDGFEYIVDSPTALNGRKFSISKKHEKNNTIMRDITYLKTSLKRII